MDGAHAGRPGAGDVLGGRKQGRHSQRRYVTIQVVRPARKEIVFEDVHFDFDRYSLRPEATRALDEAIKTLQENADLRLEIEGHTCNIGTAEYNLALGERRASAVREYLASRGIGADRLRTVSYGEERPKHDNAREETRPPQSPRRVARQSPVKQGFTGFGFHHPEPVDTMNPGNPSCGS